MSVSLAPIELNTNCVAVRACLGSRELFAFEDVAQVDEYGNLCFEPPGLRLTEIGRDWAYRITLEPGSDGESLETGSASVWKREWLTVTEAAKLFMKDMPGLSLKKARARVSAAATRGEFTTNNRTDRERRIEADSFAKWRLDKRDSDLNKVK